jgi:3-phenylpropionate/cinnamic acid dioxygenase small subunit
MSHELFHEVEAFLYHEAELLDERRYHDWLALFTDDAEYWAPVRENVLGREVEDELAGADESAYFEDTKQTLEQRVRRLDTGTAWAETPPSRTRRLISNVRVKRESDSEVEVASNFILYRSRLETDEDLYVGTRRDTLRRVDGQLRIARRTIILDQAVLKVRNISVFL